ncbi:hypothetical protein [Pandoraea morbifera]|uniref:hypothetical protein n=1 Tax=Pandoraea morbifera TaxID=2508300 RepID=UPI00124227F8|nr:hypothetical protein [Pandoraea morbifera]
MSFDLANTVTAVATAVTGIYAAMQYHFMRKQAEPHLSGFLESREDGLLLLELHVFPSTLPLKIHRLTVDGCKLSEAMQPINTRGRLSFEPAHSPESKSLPLDVRVPPERVSGESVTVRAFAAPLSSRNSFLISVHTRFMCLPVKYSIELKARSARA